MNDELPDLRPRSKWHRVRSYHAVLVGYLGIIGFINGGGFHSITALLVYPVLASLALGFLMALMELRREGRSAPVLSWMALLLAPVPVVAAVVLFT